MKSYPFRAVVALTAALSTAATPLLASAQSSFEYRALKPGLVVNGSSSDQAGPQLSTSAIDFGDVSTNTTETRQVRVSNTGTGTLSFTAEPAVTGDAAFAAGATSCGASLAAGADCLAEATFSPMATGTFNGVLTLTTALAGSPHEVTLVGTAFNPVSLANTALPEGKVGVLYSYDFKQLLSVSNEVSPDKSLATWSGSGTLPAGLSFNTGTGVLAGTPSAAHAGASYTVVGTYKNNQGQQVYTIKVGEAVLEVARVEAGSSHTCAVTPAGGLKCWGYNSDGQLGDGTTKSSSVPVAVQGLSSGVQSVSAGSGHTCALTTTGAVKCWGRNYQGELGNGNGSTTYSTTPTLVSGLGSGVQSVSAGSSHTCALTTSGAVKCWGQNIFSQLGDGTATSRNVPVAVQGLSSGVESVAAGAIHTCALTTSGAVKCWGYNSDGQLGDGTTTSRNAPVTVQGLDSGVLTVAASYGGACVATMGGAVKCWGQNIYGQVGDGTTTQRNAPVAVQGLSSGVRRVAAGGRHHCAQTTEGAMKCWGYNVYGQLGNNSYTNSSTPVAVQGLNTGVLSMAAGDFHTCAVANSGALKCWGRNQEAQLGDGTSEVKPTPVNVLPGT